MNNGDDEAMDVDDINDDEEDEFDEEEDDKEKTPKKETKKEESKNENIDENKTPHLNKHITKQNDEANIAVSTLENNVNNQKDENETDECPINSVCHFVYPKGYYISLNEIEAYKFTKIKKNKKFLFFKKKENTLEKPYLTFFDENFIYFLKDIVVNKNDQSLRKVGNKYSLFHLINADFNQNEDKSVWVIKLEFLDKSKISNARYITKEMRFDKENAEGFYEALNVCFKKLNMKMSNSSEDTSTSDKSV